MARTARRPTLLSPTALVRRNAIYKGFLGGSRGWMVLGGIFWFATFLRRTLGKNEVIVASEVLRPGEFVTIRTIAPPTRAQRRAAKTSA
jgi:hypothetical protein